MMGLAHLCLKAAAYLLSGQAFGPPAKRPVQQYSGSLSLSQADQHAAPCGKVSFSSGGQSTIGKLQEGRPHAGCGGRPGGGGVGAGCCGRRPVGCTAIGRL